METIITSLSVLGAINISILYYLLKLYKRVEKQDKEVFRRKWLESFREFNEIKELLFMIAGDKIESSQCGEWHYKEIPKGGDWVGFSPGDPYWRYQEDYLGAPKSKSYYQRNIEMLEEEIQSQKDEEKYVKSLQERINNEN